MGIGAKREHHRRTFLLGLSLKKIELSCGFRIKVENVDGDSNSSGGSNNGINDSSSLEGGMHVNGTISVSFDEIRVHLFSLGLLLMGFDRLRKIYHSIRNGSNPNTQPHDVANASDIRQVLSNESEVSNVSEQTSTDANASSYPPHTPLYMIHKFIGGGNIDGFRMSASASFQEGDRSEKKKDQAHIKWSLRSKRLTAELITNKENGRADIVVDVGNLKTRLKSGSSACSTPKNQSSYDYFHHCIQVKSVRVAMGLRTSLAAEKWHDNEVSMMTLLSFHVLAMDEVEKGGIVDVTTSCVQMMSLSAVANEWIWPLMAIFQIMQRQHQQDQEDGIENQLKEGKSKFAISTISVKLRASVTLRDGRSLEDTCTSDPLRLSTLVGFDLQLIPTQYVQISLSDTSLVKMIPGTAEIANSVDLMLLDEGHLSIGIDGTTYKEESRVLNLTEIVLGNISVDIQDEEDTEQIASLVLSSYQAIALLLPPKTRRESADPMSAQTPQNSQTLSLTCMSCEFNVSAFIDDLGGMGRRPPVNLFAKVMELSVRITSHHDGTKYMSIESAQTEAFFAFVPHDSLPTYNQCANEVYGDDFPRDEGISRDEGKYVKFLATVSKYHMSITTSAVNTTTDTPIQSQVTLIEVSKVSLKEYLGLSLTDVEYQMNELVKTDGRVQVTINNEKSDEKEFQRIEVKTLCQNVRLLWSPVLQWYIGSALKTFRDIMNVHLQNDFSQQEELKTITTEKTITKLVTVESKEALVKARFALAGASIVDIVVVDLFLSLANNETDTWDKPDILFKVGRTRLNLNESDFDVAVFDSIRYFNGIRRATPDEINAYTTKRGKTTALCEEIVTGHCGTPLVEMVEIGARESATIDLPPKVDLGAVIEDVTTSLRVMEDGMIKSKLANPKKPRKRKYQLMNISLEIPILDVHFLEAEEPKTIIHGKRTRFGRPKRHHAFLDRWRFLIKGFKVNIKRHTPPDVTQNQLRSLDEDKSRQYIYGPMIQGGEFHIGFDRVINTLHPLNLVTPLGDITNLKIEGLLYLASLSPEMKYFKDGHQFCIPVKCHHPNSSVAESRTMACGCDYAMTMFSRDIPVKIYYDLNLTSDCVHSTYGDILQPSIERLMNIIQRLIPKPPLIDPREPTKSMKDPSLTWWDNLRYQFHGPFKWEIKKMSFRWLLDTVPRYDWSILLTSNNLILSHSTGIAALEMDNAIFSLPDSSYHMLDSSPIHNGYSVLQNYLENSSSGFKRRRHPLILFPKFKTQFEFKWAVKWVVSDCQRNHSSRHHNVYMTDMLATPASKNDKFQYYRSHGWDIEWTFELQETQKYGSWIALRGDVLPWITHKSPRPSAPPSEDDEDALPRVNGIQINIDVTALNIGAWFDEQIDSRASNIEDASLEGIFLQIPKLHYSRSKKRGTSIDLYGPIQAALLEILQDYDAHLAYPTLNSKTISAKLLDWDPRNHQRCYHEINDVHSLLFFDSLQMSAKKIRSLDYLLKVDQIKIMDKALEDICTNSPQRSRRFNLKKTEAPWSVLVAGMKLLWTVDIRDSVIAIVKDVLFAINFMQVNSRGTPQLLDAGAGAGTSPIPNDGQSHGGAKVMEKECSDDNDSDASAIEVIANEIIGGVDIVPVTLRPNSPEKPKSHLEHLLSRRRELSTSPPIYQNSGKISRKSLYKTINTSDSHSSTEKFLPTFDLHLTNPQIQFLSEKTGGSVIIGIRGAYIEGKKFKNLLVKNEAFENNDIRLETLFRRTEFLYTLDRMELFSVSNSVDVGIGLQWLTFDHDTSIADSTHGSDMDANVSDSPPLTFFEDEDALPSLDTENRCDRKWIFPKDLEIFDTKAFTIPSLGQSIMNPSTFKTRQEFHRPPIDLTKEELKDVINENLISPLEVDRKNALDYLEFFIDELSFHLDSYQFSTTLDVVRNTMLEPLKPREERYYQKSKEDIPADEDERYSSARPRYEQDKKIESSGAPQTVKDQMDENQFRHELIEQSKKSKAHYNSLTYSMEKLLQERDINPKKWRELLRTIANELVVDLEDMKINPSGEPSTRLIEYNLCKAKWKIAGEDSINDAEINFTDFKGTHDFSADGSVSSKISLENMHVTSHKPSTDAMDFPDPTIIVKTILGEKRSPCQRCGLEFDRGSNEINSCRFHPGNFQGSSHDKSTKWSCCGANDARANGCVARPHTGSEKAMDIQFDAFPRVVEGITLYKFIEANVYPGVTHTTIVQLTRSMTKSFMNYFLGDTDGIVSADTKKMLSASQSATLSTSDTSSIDSTETSSHSQSTPSFEPNTLRDSRRYLLFGEAGIDEEMQSAPALFDPQQVSVSKSDKERKGDDKGSKDTEIVFLRNWNIGDINIKLSIAGFHKIIDVSDVDLVISGFHRRYKIGSVQHLAKKFLAHLIKNLLTSSLGILKVKLSGNKQLKHADSASRNPVPENTLEALEEEDEAYAAEDAVENLLLATPKTKQKKKKRRWIGRKRKGND